MNIGAIAKPRGRVAVASLWAGIAATVVALLGMVLTDLGPWYQALVQPAWKPSDLWFGPMWTLIYTLAAAAGVKAWMAASTRPQRRGVLAAFVLNGVLNILWSGLFFAARRPDWALIEVVFLWLSVALLMAVAGRLDPVAAWLLLPYLLWVAFAGALNLAVVRLNPAS